MAKHIKDKDKADLLTKRLGNQFDELSKTLQGLSFQELFKSSNQSLSLWQQKQNSSLFAFKREVATTIQTEGKKLVNELKQGSKELGLTSKQTKTLVSQVNAGANYLNRAVIQGHQRDISQIQSSVKTIRSDASDVLYKEIQKQVYRSNRTGVVYSVPTEDGNYKYRNWKWENYMEMKVRTDLQNEITENMIDAGNESGVVFYICSFYGDCAKDHVDYQGKIYYADGWHAFAPKDRVDEIEAYIRANNLMSVREVTTNAPYLTTRPNCRHYFQYISIDDVLGIKSNNDLKKKRDDLNLNFNGKYQPDKYEALQSQRANERAIRETKSQIDILKMSIENAPKDIDKKELFTMNAQLTNLNHQLRERQKVQRKLIEKYDNLERRYDREKPGAMVSDMRGTQKVLDYKDPNKKDYSDFKINFKESNTKVIETNNYYESTIKHNYSKNINFDYKKDIVFTRERISHVKKHDKAQKYLPKVFDFINNPDDVLKDKKNPHNTRNIKKYVDDKGYLFITVRFATKQEKVLSSIISVRYSTK